MLMSHCIDSQLHNVYAVRTWVAVYVLLCAMRRIPEILFQPSLVGVDQAGVVDTMDFVLKSYTEQQQLDMVQVALTTLHRLLLLLPPPLPPSLLL